MGPPSYMRSVVDRNFIMRHVPVYVYVYLYVYLYECMHYVNVNVYILK